MLVNTIKMYRQVRSDAGISCASCTCLQSSQRARPVATPALGLPSSPLSYAPLVLVDCDAIAPL